MRQSEKSRVPSGFAGERLALGELKRRGFHAQLGPRGHGMFVRARDSPSRRIQVKTDDVTPWYVRRKCFVGCLANQVTVFVLLGLQTNLKTARFFLVKTEIL
jgi:hypothetical protein